MGLFFVLEKENGAHCSGDKADNCSCYYAGIQSK